MFLFLTAALLDLDMSNEAGSLRKALINFCEIHFVR